MGVRNPAERAAISRFFAQMRRYVCCDEIHSNEPTDAKNQEAVRQHLAMIGVKIPQGDFALPMFLHSTVPPGVEDMKRLKGNITYRAEKSENGAQLRIVS